MTTLRSVAVLLAASAIVGVHCECAMGQQGVETAWVRHYDDSSATNYPDIAVDAMGNVFVAATSYSGCLEYSEDCFGSVLTLKYSPAGDLLWVRQYEHPGDDLTAAEQLTLDDDGNLYIVGTHILKYDSDGSLRWAVPFDGNDKAYDIAVDSDGNVFTTGADTRKLDSDGNLIWVAPLGGLDLELDAFGHVLVTGWFGNRPHNWVTAKYSPTGDTVWVRRQDGWARALAIDADGNVYVTGTMHSSDTGYDWVTIKYSATGDSLWGHSVDGGHDIPRDVIYSPIGRIYVSGRSGAGDGWGHLGTLAYSLNGDALWMSRAGYSHDIVKTGSLAADASGNVYVTGMERVSQQLLTTRYDSSGTVAWLRYYSHPHYDYGCASDLTVDDAGNVYIVGISDVITSVITTIKYAPCSGLRTGDVNCDGVVDLADIVMLGNHLDGVGNPTESCIECCGDLDADSSVSQSDYDALYDQIADVE